MGNANFASLPAEMMSDELREFFGLEAGQSITSLEGAVHLTNYIRTNRLHAPENHLIVHPDERLAAIFGTHEPVHIARLFEVLPRHLTETTAGELHEQ